MKKLIYAILVIVLLVIGVAIYKAQTKVETPPVDAYLQPVRINDVVYGKESQFGLPLGVPAIEYEDVEEVLGASTPFRPSEFKTTLSQSLAEGHSGTTLVVNSITTKDDNTLDPTVLGDTVVLHISPGKTNAEIVVCTSLTAATKTFTGCTFGYRFDQNTTASGNVKAHAPGETVIISDDDHYLSVQYADLDGTNVFSGNFAVATSSEDVARIYFLSSPTSTAYTANIWYNRSSGALGFRTSTSGDLTWNTDGTTFNVEAPLTFIGGEVNLATSTNEFDLDGSNLSLFFNNSLTSNSSGIAVATTTNFIWTGTHSFTGTSVSFTNATATTAFVIGTNPTWATRAGLWVGGNATTTGSISAAELCISGANCVTRLPLVASTTLGTISHTGSTATSTLTTYTIPSGPVNGTIYHISTTASKSGANNTGFLQIAFNSRVLFDNSQATDLGCAIPATGGDIPAVAWVDIVFGEITGANQKVLVYGQCIGGPGSAAGSANSVGYIATTSIATAEAHNVDFQVKLQNSGDTMTLQGLDIIKY